MPPRHPSIARALGMVRATLSAAVPDPGGARVLVACSGGPDSVALLGLLELLADPLGLEPCVGHVDHGLRPEAADEAALVERLAKDHGRRVLVTRVRLDDGPGLAARAREARRAALREQAAEVRADVVALGHTATDQVETMLLHLARGAGLEGIAAMDRVARDGPGAATVWVRPLLELTRDETRELARRLELPFVDDPTNVDRSHPRVRIRADVLPVLRELNPRLEHAFAGAAAAARDAAEALASQAAAELGRRRVTPVDGALSTIAVHGIDDVPRAVRTMMIRMLCREAGAASDMVPHEVVAAVDAALCGESPTRPRSWDLHPRLRLCVSGAGMWVERRT